MNTQTTIKIGQMTVTAEAADIKDVFRALSPFTVLPTKCGNEQCCSERILPSARRTKNGDEYFEMICPECDFKLTLHVYKDRPGFFITDDDRWEHKDAWRKNSGDGNYEQRGPSSRSVPAGGNDDEPIF